MSGHFLRTLICEVYFHKHRDLHSRCTNVCTKQTWKKIFSEKNEIQMSKRNTGCTYLSYQYQCSYLLQHSNERKEKKWCTSLTYRHQHSYWYQHFSNKKPCQHKHIRITVILVQEKFTASFLSWSSTILFFLISHDLFHTPFKEVWREYMYLFLNPSFNLPKNRANMIFTVTESCSAESFHTKPQMILWFQLNLGKCCHTLELSFQYNLTVDGIFPRYRTVQFWKRPWSIMYLLSLHKTQKGWIKQQNVQMSCYIIMAGH